MKHSYQLFLASVLLASCTSLSDEPIDRLGNKSTEETNQAENYNISQKAVDYFVRNLTLEDGSKRTVESIEPIISGRDTLLYFVNYKGDKGWVVISGDRRTEPILASSLSGNLSGATLGSSSIWLENLSVQLKRLKSLSGVQPADSATFETWGKIDSLVKGLYPRRSSGRSMGEARALSDLPDPKNEEYDIIFLGTKAEVVLDKQVGPLIKTKWGQQDPWNKYTPQVGDENKQALTGCVATTGAQMLYYFHYLKGKPEAFYSKGDGSGWAWNGTSSSALVEFSDARAESWDKMPLNRYEAQLNPDGEGTRLVSLLMSYVGYIVGMKYTKDKSSAKTESLVDLFREVGIRSEFSNYKPELVRTSLDKSLPVCISAYQERREERFIFKFGWSYSVGHSWIIDGYKDKQVRYSTRYARVPKLQDPNATIDPHNPEGGLRSKLSSIFGEFTDVRTVRSYSWIMNFGWDGSGDTADYSTGEDARWPSGGYNFQYCKEIIHNFTF